MSQDIPVHFPFYLIHKVFVINFSFAKGVIDIAELLCLLVGVLEVFPVVQNLLYAMDKRGGRDLFSVTAVVLGLYGLQKLQLLVSDSLDDLHKDRILCRHFNGFGGFDESLQLVDGNQPCPLFIEKLH